MNITKTERDQWRERLSSLCTGFNAAHADFTIRLLDVARGSGAKGVFAGTVKSLDSCCSI